MPLQMQVTLALRNRAALEQLLAAQQDPNSPNYHKWLTPNEFGQRFGPNPADAQAVSNWLTSVGFTVTSVDLKSRSITFTGTVADAERVFSTTISKFGDGSSYANSTDPQIPSQFVGIIGAIDGLDNMRHAIPASHPIAPNSRAMPTESIESPLELATSLDLNSQLPVLRSVARPDVTIGSATAFAPSDFYTFYNENPLLNGGVNGGGIDCIAIVGDSDFLTAAVSLFNTTFGLPDNSASIGRVFPDGNPGKNADEIEALLDLEWSHAVAPNTPQVLYTSTGMHLPDAISSAVTHNVCGVINISFEFCGGSSSFFTGILDPIFAQAASQGQSVFTVSDDFGAAGVAAQMAACVAGTSRGVSEMAADPNVTAVGGTQFVPNFDGSGNNIGFVPESVWNQGNAASGGGASAIFPKPSYQAGLGVPADGARDVPDVAMIAGPPGVFVGADFKGAAGIGCCEGGTSLGAPIWTGINRLVSQISGRQGNMNPRIYRLAAGGTGGFRDVIAGNNNFNGVTGFDAGVGYDQATGWGTVDIANFVDAATTATPTPPQIFASVLPSSRSVEVGTLATAYATITNAGPGTASTCGITTILPGASFLFQTTNPANNAPIGTPNTGADIPAGGSQTYIFALTANTPIAPTDVALSFDCSNTAPAPIVNGVNTLLFSASTSAVPDILGIELTPTNDAIVNIPLPLPNTAAFAVDTINVGSAGAMITVSADTGNATLPQLVLSICQTNPTTQVCIQPPSPSVTLQIDPGDTPPFAVFAGARSPVPFDPVNNRVFVRFKDSGGVTHGSTSVAVRTP